MQFVGSSILATAAELVAGRCLIPQVGAWMSRTFIKCAKAEPTLIRRIRRHSELETLMQADAIPLSARTRIATQFDAGEPVYSVALREIVLHVEREPDALHVMSIPARCGLVRRTVHEFALMSGLADRLVAASRAGRRHLDACARHGRPSGSTPSPLGLGGRRCRTTIVG